jgi:hypothetical protein
MEALKTKSIVRRRIIKSWNLRPRRYPQPELLKHLGMKPTKILSILAKLEKQAKPLRQARSKR